MAHDIYENEGKAAFASAREVAWHGLGQVLDGAMTSRECIREAQLNYEVGLSPMIADINKQFQDTEGNRQNPYAPDYKKLLDIPNKYATYNKQTGVIYGTVGSKYTIVQNRDAFQFFDSIVGEGKAIYETAGALGQGETVFISAKLPDNIRIGNSDDVIDNYLLLTMSHDGTSAIKALFTPVRVVCANTLSIALGSASNKLSIRHTASAEDKMKQASKLLNLTIKQQEVASEVFNSIAKIRLSDDKTLDLINKLFMTDEEYSDINKGAKAIDVLSTRKSNIITDVAKYTFEDETQLLETTKGTAWGFYNGITGYFAYKKNFKSNEEKMKSNIFGNGQAVINKALSLVTQ